MPTPDGGLTTDEYEAVQLAKHIGQFVNYHDDRDAGQAFAETIVYGEHRTLQQSIMRTLVAPLIDSWANAYAIEAYDERNRATCEMAWFFREAWKKDGTLPLWPPALPFI